MVRLVVRGLTCLFLLTKISAFLAGPARSTRIRLAPLSTTLSPEDEELIRRIRGPLGAAPSAVPKSILIFSDTTGVTARSAVVKSLQQFNGCDERYYSLVFDDEEPEEEEHADDLDCVNLHTTLVPFCQSEEEVAAHLKGVTGALVVFTFADAALRESAARMCELSGLSYVDLLGPMFENMGQFFDRQPLGLAPQQARRIRRRTLSDDYYRRIEAVEYTLKCDDGMKPRLWKEADVVLIGVSRTGKTPLSVVLSQTMGLRVANVPIVVDLPPPPKLLTLDRRRVFCLMLDPDELRRIRRYRLSRELKNVAKSAHSTYADEDYLMRDLENARQVARENGFTQIDVTGRAVEETASYIRALLNDRFPDMEN